MKFSRSVAKHSPGTQHRAVKPSFGMATGIVMVVALAAGCGSDDAEEAYCDSGESLQANIAGLGDVDLIGEGTSALEDQVGDIRSDLDDLKANGADVVADEVDALGTAVEQLGSALENLTSDVSVEGVETLTDAAGGVLTSAGAVIDKLATVCD